MIFYHGTTKEMWAAIKFNGYLFGTRSAAYPNLSIDLEKAKKYGAIILKIDYEAQKIGEFYEPIPLRCISKVDEENEKMIDEITGYRTSDGQIFASLPEAKENENVIELRGRIIMVVNEFKAKGHGFTHQEIVDDIVKCRMDFERIFKDYTATQLVGSLGADKEVT